MMNRFVYKWRLVFYFGLCLMLFNEFIAYWIAYSRWPDIHRTHNENSSIRLLLVADPQLIGDNDEPWYRSSIAKWDSDRYLRTTYSLAQAYVNPDLVIFLGDLFDEGVKSSDKQYQRYYERFNRIFEVDKYRDKYIFISGDNDIGGEYHGDRNRRLEKRFENVFGPLVDFTNFKFLKILKMDLDYTVSFYMKDKRNLIQRLIRQNDIYNTTSYTNNFMVILNHVSLISKSPDELNNVILDSKATLVLKGDNHKFYIAKYSTMSDRVVEYMDHNKDPSNFYTFNINGVKKGQNVKEFYEVSTPTCSYRMGVPQMGYGMMTLTENGSVYFSVLWLPARLFHLVFYGIFFMFLFFSVCIRLTFRMLFKLKRNFYNIVLVN